MKKKRKLKKRILAEIICLALVATNLPVFTATVQAESGWIEVATYDRLRDELAKSGDKKIKVTADISCVDKINDNFLVHSAGTCTLDLNGHNISREPSNSTDIALFYIDGGKVAITNSTEKEATLYYENAKSFSPANTIYTVKTGSVVLGAIRNCGPITVDGSENGITNAGAISIYRCVTVGSPSSNAHYVSGTKSENYIFGGTFYGGLDIQNNAHVYSATIYGNTRMNEKYALTLPENTGFPESLIYVDGEYRGDYDVVSSQGYCHMYKGKDKVEIRHYIHSYEVLDVREATLEQPGIETTLCLTCGEITQKELPFEYYAGEKAGYQYDKASATFTVYGTGNMYGYDYDNSGTCAPWFDHGAHTLYSNMKKIVIKDGITRVGDEAFMMPENLLEYNYIKEIQLPLNKIDVGRRAFAKNIYVERVTVPAGTLRMNCFSGCTSLKNVTLGGVTLMSAGIFEGDTALKEIRFTSDPPESINQNAFAGVEATVYYPADNPKWTSAITDYQYGGTITWVPVSTPVEPPEGNQDTGGNHNNQSTFKTQKITTAKIRTIKASKLKKKSIKLKLKAKTDGNGNLTYKVTAYPKKMKKFIKVTTKGVVTLKKKAKKGKYKVTITAAENGDYKKTTKVVTIKVK